MRSRVVLALGGLALAGVATWVASRSFRVPSTAEPAGARDEEAWPEPETVEGPTLVAAAGPEAPESTEFQLRVTSADGKPLAFAWVQVGMRVPVRGGMRKRVLRVQADATGLARLDVEAPRIDWVRVEVEGRKEPLQVGTWPGGATPAVVAERLLVAQDTAMFVATTEADDLGPRGDLRFLYRVLAPGTAADATVRVDRSDLSGQVVLGPFPTGAEIELRIQQHERLDPQRPPLDGWLRYPVGRPEPVRIAAPVPGLRLRVLGVPPDAEIPVGFARFGFHAVQDGRLVDGVLEVGGPSFLRAHGVVLGPLPDGRCAVLRRMEPEVEPIDVELEAGQPVHGRATRSGSEGLLRGTVTIMGPGWEARSTVASDGAFRFEGLPPTFARIVVEAEDSGDVTRWVGCVMWRVSEGGVQVPLTRAFRVEGRVAADTIPAGKAGRALLVVEGGAWSRQLVLGDDRTFGFLAPEGPIHMYVDAPRPDGDIDFEVLWQAPSLDRDHVGLQLPVR